MNLNGITLNRPVSAPRFLGKTPELPPPDDSGDFGLPEVLHPVSGVSELFHSVFYTTENDLAKRLTLYYHTHPDHKDDILKLSANISKALQAKLPAGWTVVVKDFRDRPANAVVIESGETGDPQD